MHGCYTSFSRNGSPRSKFTPKCAIVNIPVFLRMGGRGTREPNRKTFDVQLGDRLTNNSFYNKRLDGKFVVGGIASTFAIKFGCPSDMDHAHVVL